MPNFRTAQLQAEASRAKEAESEAVKKAAVQQGKVEVLQKVLQKAEERAATLEFQVGFGAPARTFSDACSML